VRPAVFEDLGEHSSTLTSYAWPHPIYDIYSVSILSDVGEPYLYSSENFEIIEKGGEDWITESHDGKDYSYPSEFGDYFFEEYFETYDLKKRTMIRRYLEKLIAEEINVKKRNVA
jgi:hypothetical protein